MSGKLDVKEESVTHAVKVSVVGRTIVYDKPCLIAYRGDTIAWTLEGGLPFAVVVKALHTPLAWASHAAPKGGKPLEVKVRKDAVPGVYPYAFCVCVRDTLVVDDPEIIIPPPKGGRG